MYNRILNRPMFKLGGKTNDAQGTGITSGLDTPRSGYEGGGTIGGGAFTGTPMGDRTGFQNILPKPKPEVPFGAQIRTAMNKLRVNPKDYRQATWEGVGAGFGDPNTKTLSEALYKANMMRREGIKPLEASVAEQKFELSKLPFERTMAMDVAKAGIAETATQTREKILTAALKDKNMWESDPANKGQDFRDSEGYQDWEFKIIQATNGKITTKQEATQSAIEILMLNDTFAKLFTMLPMMKDDDPQKKIYQAQLDAQIKKLVDLFMGVSQGRTSEARGGRIGYNIGVGPNVMEEKVTDTFKMPGETIQASEQVEEVLPKTGATGDIPMPGQDPYMLLRARLPQEITDDVVRLIAYNPDAFADFAAIESQEDVMLFNQKYGVELVLPTEQA